MRPLQPTAVQSLKASVPHRCPHNPRELYPHTRRASCSQTRYQTGAQRPVARRPPRHGGGLQHRSPVVINRLPSVTITKASKGRLRASQRVTNRLPSVTITKASKGRLRAFSPFSLPCPATSAVRPTIRPSGRSQVNLANLKPAVRPSPGRNLVSINQSINHQHLTQHQPTNNYQPTNQLNPNTKPQYQTDQTPSTKY